MGVVESIDAAVGSVVVFLPSLIAAIIILVIAWIIGRALGKVVSTALDKVGVDDALRKTAIGKSIESSGTSIPRVFDLIVRWFIYIIGIMAAVNVLGIPMLTSFTQSVVMYIPNLIAGLLILIVGFIVADFIGDAVRRTGETSDVAYIDIFSAGLKIFLYFVVIILAMDQLRINTSIIYTFANALAWGIAIGVGVGLGIGLGFGLKDKMPQWLESIKGDRMKQSLQKTGERTVPSEKAVTSTPRRPGVVPEAGGGT